MTLQQIRYVIAVADCKSINKAAKEFYLSQPALSGAIHDLEDEIGVELFERTNRGAYVTSEGAEFLSYARQITEQYNLLEDKFINKNKREKFGVSTQHYTFAVQAFIDLISSYGMEKYEFNISETKTSDVINDVKNFKSEIGVLFLDDFNNSVLSKIIAENSLVYEKLFDCNVYVYLSATHPLASRDVINFMELQDYPCLAFDQGERNSFYFAEEVLSTYYYDRIIRVNDRGTMLNLMIGLNGYTLCSGIICENLNGNSYKAIKLDDKEVMSVIYIKRAGSNLSSLGSRYVELLKKYKDNVMK